MTTSNNYKWTMISGDSSEIEVEQFLDRHEEWVKKTSQHEPCQVCPMRVAEHTMHYTIYECRAETCADLSHVAPCSWLARTTLCDITKRGTIETHGQHISSAPKQTTVSLNLTMKRFIRETVELKFRASRILNAMIDAGLITSNATAYLRRVQRYAYNYRTRGLRDNNDVGEMEGILVGRPYQDSLPENTAFGFGYPIDPAGQPTLSRGTDERPLVVGFASKATILNLSYAEDNILHVDATFKLNTAGFPTVVIGVSDVQRQFHPVAVFIVSDIRQAQLETVPRDLQDYLSSVPVSLHPTVLKHVYHIHYARTLYDLDERVAEAVQAWKSDPALREFERRFSRRWLSGRFTRWQCSATPPGFAKTNNPVKRFNKEINRDYSLRSLVSVNGLAEAFLQMCHHRSVRVQPFKTEPIPSEKQASRFCSLQRDGRLSLSSLHRGSISFLVEGVDRQIFRVFQSGTDSTRARKKPLTAAEELELADQATEVEGQPRMGWVVDVDATVCECRNWFKFGYCVHLIHARVHQDLPVQGVQTKRTFAYKGKQHGKGRRAEVGHALEME